MNFFRKILFAISKPRIAYNYLLRKTLSAFNWQKGYASVTGLRSESDDGDYPSYAFRAAHSQRMFKSFRRHPIYQKILGFDQYEDGKRFIATINENYDSPFEKNILEFLQSMDSVGGPIVYKYSSLVISPAILRYYKTALHIKKLFGAKLVNANVAEIGGGFGAQAVILDRIIKFKSYDIYDLYDVNFLINKYTESFQIRSCLKTMTINKVTSDCSYDFIVSNFAFSELPKSVQLNYLDKIIEKSSMGYMTMNSGFSDSPFNSEKLSFKEINSYIPSCKVIRELPPEKGRYIIIWGDDN